MPLRISDHRAEHRRPVVVCRTGDHEEASPSPQVGLTGRDQPCRNRHESPRPGDPREFAHHHRLAHAPRTPECRHVWPLVRGIEHFRQRRDRRPFKNPHSAISNPQSAIRNPHSALRNPVLPRVSGARIGNPHPTTNRRMYVARRPFSLRQPARAQPTRRALVHVGDSPATQRGSTSPCLETPAFADQSEVQERCHRVMTQFPQDATPHRPAQLLRHAAGAADAQRDACAGCEIERAAVIVHRKSIRDQLHARGRCKTSARSNRAAPRRTAARSRQIIRIE